METNINFKKIQSVELRKKRLKNWRQTKNYVKPPSWFEVR